LLFFKALFSTAVFFTCQQFMFCRPLLQNKLLVVRMVGIEYMNDDPAEVDILYGKVYAKDGSHILQEIADGVISYFSDKGLYC
jgi:activating signal cointegrator complex subunit 1